MTKFEKWLLENNIKYEKMNLTNDGIPSFGVSAEHEVALLKYTMSKKYKWEYRGDYNYILIKVFEQEE